MFVHNTYSMFVYFSPLESASLVFSKRSFTFSSSSLIEVMCDFCDSLRSSQGRGYL